MFDNLYISSVFIKFFPNRNHCYLLFQCSIWHYSFGKSLVVVIQCYWWYLWLNISVFTRIIWDMQYKFQLFDSHSTLAAIFFFQFIPTTRLCDARQKTEVVDPEVTGRDQLSVGQALRGFVVSISDSGVLVRLVQRHWSTCWTSIRPVKCCWENGLLVGAARQCHIR